MAFLYTCVNIQDTHLLVGFPPSLPGTSLNILFILLLDEDECADSINICNCGSLGPYGCMAFCSHTASLAQTIYLNILFILLPDVDECAVGIHTCTCGSQSQGCTATCTNTDGTYVCGCSLGFVLDVDGLTCIGKYCEALLGIEGRCKYMYN